MSAAWRKFGPWVFLALLACAAPRVRQSGLVPLAGPTASRPTKRDPPEGALFPVRQPHPPHLGMSAPVDLDRLAALLLEIELARIRGDAGALYERYIEEANAALALAPDAPGTRLANLPRSASEARLLAALATNDEDEGFRLLKLVQESDPHYGMVHVGMGILYERWRIPHQARQAYARALQMMPGSPFARLGVARIDLAQGAVAAARAALELLVAEVPSYAEAHYTLGALLKELGDHRAARERLEAAVALDPSHFRALVKLAEVRLRLGAKEGAVSAYQQAAAIHPGDRALQLALAKLLHEKGDLGGAALAYQAAMKDSSSDVELLRAVAGLYARLGDSAEEAAALERLVKLEPKDGASLRRLAELRAGAGDAEAAEKAWRAAIAADADDGRAHYGLAQLLKARKALREALFHLRETVSHGGPKEAQEELHELERAAALPRPPLQGADVNTVYKEASWSLRRFYKTRLASMPSIGGKLAVQVMVGDDGVAYDAVMVEDSVKDPYLEAHLYWALRDARYPRGRRDYTFRFELSPGAVQ